MVIFNMVGGGGQKKLKATVYGCQIEINNSDPNARVSYPAEIFGQSNGAASVVTPASGTGEMCMGDWAECNLISGIHRELGNSTDGWTEVADKRSAVVGDGTNDAMVYVPTWFFRMENDGTYITIGFSDTNIDGNWQDYAGSVGSNRVGHFRVGCYGGYNLSNKLYSRGGVTPSYSQLTIGNFIKYAQARGTGYDIMTWYQWTYLVALSVLLYKSTDLQTALGRGNVPGSEGSIRSEQALEYHNDYGMSGSTTSDTEQMAFFWIQNMWGNLYQILGCAMTDSKFRLKTYTGYSSITAFDKTLLSPSLDTNMTGVLKNVVGTTDAGFFPTEKVVSSGSPEYFCDNCWVSDSDYPIVGGQYQNSGQAAGPFFTHFTISSNGTGYQTARLTYRL